MLRHGGEKVELKDRSGRSAFSYAIVRRNVTLTLALISKLCGIAGDTTAEVAAHLSRRDLSRLYQLLMETKPVGLGRATALLFLTDPNGALQVILRGITAVRSKARAAKNRDPEYATALEATEELMRAAITALLHHSKDLLRPIVETTEMPERREVVCDLLRASHDALEVALDAGERLVAPPYSQRTHKQAPDPHPTSPSV